MRVSFPDISLTTSSSPSQYSTSPLITFFESGLGLSARTSNGNNASTKARRIGIQHLSFSLPHNGACKCLGRRAPIFMPGHFCAPKKLLKEMQNSHRTEVFVKSNVYSR